MKVSVWCITGGIWEVQHGIDGLGCFVSRDAEITWAESKGYKVTNK